MNLLNNGEDFTDLLKDFLKIGQQLLKVVFLPKFGVGKMVPTFESVLHFD